MQVKHAVVVVTTYDEYQQPLQQGSGFFIASDRIVTNHHTITSAREIRIKSFTGETALVKDIFATDPRSDLAILQINSHCHDTTSLQVADISANEGDGLLSVGNQVSAGWKVSAGKVGATWNFEHLESRMQVTAGLVVGSSGEVLVKLRGYMVGIVVRHGTRRNSKILVEQIPPTAVGGLFRPNLDKRAPL
jgi:Trypsin-like serine proteases, typically periplasmic, contain C-terminal PDZ domain